MIGVVNRDWYDLFANVVFTFPMCNTRYLIILINKKTYTNIQYTYLTLLVVSPVIKFLGLTFQILEILDARNVVIHSAVLHICIPVELKV